MTMKSTDDEAPRDVSMLVVGSPDSNEEEETADALLVGDEEAPLETTANEEPPHAAELKQAPAPTTMEEDYGDEDEDEEAPPAGLKQAPPTMEEEVSPMMEEYVYDDEEQEALDEEEGLLDDEEPMEDTSELPTMLKSPGAGASHEDPAAAKDDAELKKPGAVASHGEDPAVQKGKAEAPAKKAPAAPEAPAGDKDKPPVKKKKKEINPKFKDMQETGNWGEISKKEIYIASGVILVIIIAVVIGVVVALGNNDDEAPGEPPVRPTKSPTMAPTNIGPQKELVYALDAIDFSDLTYLYQQDLPLVAEEYEGLMDDPTASAQQRAMSWLLYEDERDISSEVGERWALASMYYGLAGENWTSAENWLSSEDVCEWEHITCDPLSGDIREVNLESNNLVGTIPSEIALLNTTQSIWLRDNQLTGPLPNEVFGSMPRLSILYLDNNQLTGEVSLAIRDNGVLSTFLNHVEG
jgi:hypothetical protein